MMKPLSPTSAIEFLNFDETVVEDSGNDFKKIDEATVQDNDIILVVYMTQSN